MLSLRRISYVYRTALPDARGRCAHASARSAARMRADYFRSSGFSRVFASIGRGASYFCTVVRCSPPFLVVPQLRHVSRGTDHDAKGKLAVSTAHAAQHRYLNGQRPQPMIYDAESL